MAITATPGIADDRKFTFSNEAKTLPKGGTSDVLSAEFANQEATNWCWAAVGAGIYEMAHPKEPRSQCEVADQVIRAQNAANRLAPPNGDACSDKAAFNRQMPMEFTLKELDLLKDFATGGYASFDLIKSEVAAGRPVVARIAWDPNNDGLEDSAHFVAITGWSTNNGEPTVYVLDPQGSAGLTATPSPCPYDKLIKAYLNSGHWVSTFFVSDLGARPAPCRR